MSLTIKLHKRSEKNLTTWSFRFDYDNTEMLYFVSKFSDPSDYFLSISKCAEKHEFLEKPTRRKFKSEDDMIGLVILDIEEKYGEVLDITETQE